MQCSGRWRLMTRWFENGFLRNVSMQVRHQLKTRLLRRVKNFTAQLQQFLDIELQLLLFFNESNSSCNYNSIVLSCSHSSDFIFTMAYQMPLSQVLHCWCSRSKQSTWDVFTLSLVFSSSRVVLRFFCSFNFMLPPFFLFCLMTIILFHNFKLFSLWSVNI